jgi:hypothetical protein
MRPPDTEAQEAAAWAAFLQRLAAHLEAQWPAMKERLGDRLPAFVELSAQQALQRGFTRAASVARLTNLWFVWGPAFHDKPGFEWAAGLLAAPREREWAIVHQLVQRSLLELMRLPDARIEPATLAAADQRLVDTFGRLGRHGELTPREPPPVPLKACDLEAAEIRLLDAAVTQHYVYAAGQWQRAPFAAPASVRVEAASPVPRLVAVLAHAPGAKPQARVQLRTRSHTVCDGDVHPALNFAGTHGLWRWAGHETRAVSWPVSTLAQPPAASGPGTAIAEETSPDIFKLDVQVCGLRDEGDALGSLSTQLWVWPAAQWLATVERKAAEPQPVMAGRAPALRGSTRCSVECDGDAQDALPLRLAFEQGLDEATVAALQTLLGVATRIPGLADVRLDGALGLLLGRAALTWGWQLGATGMAGRAFMRALGALEMKAVQSELHIESELTLGEGRARLRLHCQGEAALAVQLRRENTEPPLAAALMPAKAVFRLPFTAEVTPLATDCGALLQAAGPCTGALAGEAGLRPRLSGGSGWEWYAQLRLEAGALPLHLADPVLGVQRLSHPLWDAQVLIDWSVS